MNIIKSCLGILTTSILSTSIVFAQENATTTQNGTPTLEEKLKQWSNEEFSFEGTITKQSSTHAAFRISLGARTNYSVLFDAGYKARKNIDACLELTFDCKVSGTSLMLFERNSTVLNVIEVSEVTPSEIDFKTINNYMRSCMRYREQDLRNHPVQAQLGLEITKIRPKVAYILSDMETPPSDKAMEIITDTLDNCFKRRIKLPVGHYKLSFASQNRNFVVESIQ